jgi:hypothetical protein
MRNLKPITENTKKKITTFWNWFQKNEQEIGYAILLGINTEEVLSQITRKLDYVSKRIGYIITVPKTIDDKFSIIFTGNGCHKLFPKIIGLEEQAPHLEYFIAQAFVKPLEDTKKCLNGTDEPFIGGNYEIKISEIQMALIDYNVATKKLKIDLYLPDYEELKEYEDLESTIDYIVMQIIGEIAFHKHILQINLHQMPLEPIGLLPLIELPDYIAYLYQINSRRKTRTI